MDGSVQNMDEWMDVQYHYSGLLCH